MAVQLPNQTLVVPTPGLAEYKVRIKNQEGDLVSEFSSDSWVSLTFNHNESDETSCRFEILNQDSRAALLGTDYQVEVWRRNKVLDLDWYLEWEGFIRSLNIVLYQNDLETTVIYSVGYVHLLKRAYIMYKSGTSFTSKSGVGETVMKEFISENIGAAALASLGRETDNVLANFQLEADLARGTSWSGSRAHKGLLPTCAAISGKTGLSFDVVGIEDELLFEFRVYEGQRGLDRTIGNSDGNVPVQFSVGLGNMSLVTLSINRSNEITAAFALGPGREEARQIVVAESTDQFDSPWNRVERAYNASNQAIDELDTFSGEKLRENGQRTSINFTAVQTKESYYGKQYWWGDKVTSIFNSLRFDLRIIEVRITVSDRSGIGETITLKFMDDKR